MIEVRLFAGLAEAAGTRSLTLPAEGTINVQQLRRLLVKQVPSLQGKVDQCMVAVNHEYAGNETKVSTDDEIVFIPPVSGG